MFQKKRSKINFTKIYQAYLDSPRRELSNSGFGIVGTLLVCQQINFCVRLADQQSSCTPIRAYDPSLSAEGEEFAQVRGGGHSGDTSRDNRRDGVAWGAQWGREGEGTLLILPQRRPEQAAKGRGRPIHRD